MPSHARRQNMASLMLASLLGVWLGTGAPSSSPVTPKVLASVDAAPIGVVAAPIGAIPVAPTTPFVGPQPR